MAMARISKVTAKAEEARVAGFMPLECKQAGYSFEDVADQRRLNSFLWAILDQNPRDWKGNLISRK